MKPFEYYLILKQVHLRNLTERSLENAVKIGAKQFLIFAAGYDTFALFIHQNIFPCTLRSGKY